MGQQHKNVPYLSTISTELLNIFLERRLGKKIVEKSESSLGYNFPAVTCPIGCALDQISLNVISSGAD